MRRSFLLFALVASFAGVEHARAAGLTAAGLKTAGAPRTWQDWDGNDWEIFQFDGFETKQLTDNDVDDRYPQMSSDGVVWQGWDGNDWEIFQSTTAGLMQLTDNNLDDISAYFDAEGVIWQGWDGNDWEIFQLNGIIMQLTDNDTDDRIFRAIDYTGSLVPDAGEIPPFATLVPEPGTIVLAALGLVILSACAWRRRAIHSA